MKNFFITASMLFMCCALNAKEHVYVSTKGNDNNSGEATSPFLTLEKALKSNLSTQKTDTLFIEVESGNYFLENTININEANSRPIIVRGKEKEKPVFMGGIEVKNWEKTSDGLLRAYIPEVKRYNFYFEQFFVNNKRATLARTPNKEWFNLKNSSEVRHVTTNERIADFATQKLELYPQDIELLKGLSNEELSEIKFRFYHKWDITHKKVEYVALDSSSVYISGKGMKTWNLLDSNTRYFMYGYKSALDSAGEWYLDRNEGYVYYMPREGEDVNSLCGIAPMLDKWMIFKGDTENTIKNITFNNISFKYSSYLMPEGGDEPSQAASNVKAAIELDYSENIEFNSCEMEHTGGYALWFKRACHGNKVEKCYIADLGAGGVKIGEPTRRFTQEPVTSHNTVDNCIVTHAGSVLPCGVGIAVFHSRDNVITHNEVSDLRYSGMSIGWTWGYNGQKKTQKIINAKNEEKTIEVRLKSPAVNNYVAYNHIHHIGWGELSDMGAVYTLGVSPNTKVTNNIIHDVWSYDYGGWGLYTDEGSSYIEMTNNLVYRCKSGGFHQHYGRENKIENNILAFGHYYQAQYTRAEEHLSFSFKHNIILQDKGETLVGAWIDGVTELDYNLYYHLNGELKFVDKSFEQWKKLKEPHSVVMNPNFTDIQNDDYTFKSTKAIKRIKFNPIDYSKVGVYGSPEWIERAKLSEETVEDFKKAAALRLKKTK